MGKSIKGETNVPPFMLAAARSQRLNVLRLWAFWPLDYVELYRLAFLKAAEPARLNRRKMDEYVPLARVATDKTIAFGVVKPLHCSFFHCCYLFKIELLRRIASKEGVTQYSGPALNAGESNYSYSLRCNPGSRDVNYFEFCGEGDGTYPGQERTGNLGYLSKLGLVSDNWQNTNTEPRSEVTVRMFTHLLQSPTRSPSRTLGIGSAY